MASRQFFNYSVDSFGVSYLCRVFCLYSFVIKPLLFVILAAFLDFFTGYCMIIFWTAGINPVGTNYNRLCW